MTDTVAHVAELRRAALAWLHVANGDNLGFCDHDADAGVQCEEDADSLLAALSGVTDALARLEAENGRLREAAAIALDARDEVLASISPTLFAAMEPLRDALLHGASDD